MSDHSCLGFSGCYRDEIGGDYPLGNGYRFFLPHLMRFSAPDDWAPFEAGGINAYTYCDSDPINNIDPSGHAFIPVLDTIVEETLTGMDTAAEIAHDLTISADHAIDATENRPHILPSKIRHPAGNVADSATIGSAQAKPPGIARYARNVRFSEADDIRAIPDDEYDDRTSHPKRTRRHAKFEDQVIYAKTQMAMAEERIGEFRTASRNNARYSDLKDRLNAADDALKDAHAAVRQAKSQKERIHTYIDTELEGDLFSLRDRYKTARRLLPTGLSRRWRLLRARYL